MARRSVLIALGLFGAALLYGDGVITPAISVLGAMEGLIVVSPAFTYAVVPGTLAVLAGLFVVQRLGTHRVGGFFGPLMLVWFATIADLGIRGILATPEVLGAINPVHATEFVTEHGFGAFLLLTGVKMLWAPERKKRVRTRPSTASSLPGSKAGSSV